MSGFFFEVCWLVWLTELPLLGDLTTAAELQLAVTAAAAWSEDSRVTVCAAGGSGDGGGSGQDGVADWEEAAGELPAAAESRWWSGGVLLLVILTTCDAAGSLLAGPMVGTGVLSTRCGQTQRSPEVDKNLT